MSPRLRTPIPPLTADAWLNSGPLSPEQLVGSPLLVHVWAIGCELCKDQLPTVLEWHRALGPRGLRFVAIHTPVAGTPSGTGVEDVARATRELGITHPVAVDLTGELADAWGVESSPSYFAFDASGKLRHFHSGPSSEAPVRAALERILRELDNAQPRPSP